MIGLDNYKLLTAQETVERMECERTVWKKISWTVFGDTHDVDSLVEAISQSHKFADDQFKELLKNYFLLKNFGNSNSK